MHLVLPAKNGMPKLYADGRHVATYNIGLNMTFFIHSDWLGTERARSEYNGTLYQTCSSGPFNESLTCQAAPGITNYTDPSTIHFTGKERDTESGLDYFGTGTMQQYGPVHES